MIKVRLSGLIEECEDFVKYLKKLTDYEILHISKPYKDRDPSKFYRIYVDMVKKRD